jgi:hypothetical protein
MTDPKISSRSTLLLRKMIVHCDSCGKSVSNKIEECPFCTGFVTMTKQKKYQEDYYEDMVPIFQNRIIES